MLKIAFLAEGTDLLRLIRDEDHEAVLSILLAYTRRSSAAAAAN